MKQRSKDRRQRSENTFTPAVIVSVHYTLHSYYYHGDHLGSSNVITDETGAQTALTEFTPYGSNSGDIHLITFGAKSAISQETKNVTKKIIIGETSERFAKKALEIGAERYIPRKPAEFFSEFDLKPVA